MRRFEIHVYTDHPDSHVIVDEAAQGVAVSLADARARVTALEVRSGDSPVRLADYVIGGE